MMQTTPIAPPVAGGYLELMLRMLFYLALVCGVLWFGARWVLPRLYKQRFGPSRRMGMIDQVVLGTGRSVCLLKVVDRYFLVGVAEGGVRLMSELSAVEVEAAYPEAVGKRGAASQGEFDRRTGSQGSTESRQTWGPKE